MPAPIFSLPVTGSDPKATTKQLLESNVNAVLAALYGEIATIATGLNPRGGWDASSGAFPSGSKKGDYWIVSDAGTTDGQGFIVGDWLVALVNNASTSAYAENWFRADYSTVTPKEYATIADLALADDAIDGMTKAVVDGFNGEREYFTFVAGSTLTADGALVVDGVGGQWVSKRTVYADFAEFIGDARTFAAGTELVIPSIGFYLAKASTGSLGQPNAGGQEFDVVLGPNGYNVKQFGAVADYNVTTGVGTNNSPFFQRALDLANNSADFGSAPQVVYAPAGRYLIGTSLNATNRISGCTIRGESGFKISSVQVGTRLYGNTGDVPVIDMIGTQHGRLENLAISTADNADNPSTVGLYNARSTTSQYAQFCVVDNCTIDMSSNPAANGGMGSVGICNVAAEIFTLRDTYAKGDTGFYFGNTNIFGIVSAYQTQGGPTSCSTVYFEGSTVVHSYNIIGAPLVARGAAFMNGAVYTANSSNGAGSRGFDFIGKQWGHKLRIFVEFSQRFGKCESLADCQLDILGSVSNKERYLESSASFNGFTNTEIKFLTTFDHTIVAPDYWLKNNAGDICRNLKILAPAAPAIRFTVPTATSTNLLNCEFVSNSSNGNSISRTQFITRTSDYTEVPWRMGSQRFWVDDFGMLRQKPSADPASATDGLPLAKLVSPPASATAAGAPGQWARSVTYLYIYTGDGTTHTWVRAAVATW
jgi:hypothetical protein